MNKYIQKFRESIAKLNEEQIIYRTYADKPYLNNIDGSFMNKPSKGLWGCRDNGWKEWCEENDFGYDSHYFEWTLKPESKLYTVSNKNDFIYLLKNYQLEESDGNVFIDYSKLAKDYDAIELTKNGNMDLHYGIETDDPELQDPKYRIALTMAMNTWDVPSICVFNPSKTVNVINKPIEEDTVKQGNSWTNKGKEGTHGTFKTKKQADAQRKAMFANGYKG